MPIENRELAAGTRLVARYKKQDRTCEVEEPLSSGLRGTLCKSVTRRIEPLQCFRRSGAVRHKVSKLSPWTMGLAVEM